MPLAPGYEGSLVPEIRAVENEFLVALQAFQVAIKAEARPGEPTPPLHELTTDIRLMPSEQENTTCVVRGSSTGEIVGRGWGFIERTGENDHLFWAEIDVLPPHRRNGIGSWLLQQLAESADAAGAEILSADTISTIPAGEQFARKFDAEPKQVNRESELDLATLDWTMVDRWVEEGPSRAPGYVLELIEGVYPESHYDDVIAWWEIMNTAPKDDMSWNDDHLTHERLAEWEAQFSASSTQRWEYIARHAESGACAGVTNVRFADWNPAVVHQGDTGVHPDHRGRALGKWLKAAMLQKIRVERPQAHVVRTDNAFSNDPMLGINNALGFRESRAYTVWEVPVKKVLDLPG